MKIYPNNHVPRIGLKFTILDFEDPSYYIKGDDGICWIIGDSIDETFNTSVDKDVFFEEIKRGNFIIV